MPNNVFQSFSDGFLSSNFDTTTNYSITPSDDVVYQNGWQLTVPGATSLVGKLFNLKASGNSGLYLVSGSDTIDGGSPSAQPVLNEATMSFVSVGALKYLSLVNQNSQAAEAHRITSDQTTVADTAVEIVLNEHYTAPIINQTNGRYTCVYPGNYFFSVGMDLSIGVSAPTAIDCFLLVNGAGAVKAIWERTSITASKEYMAYFNGTAYLNAGDYVSAWVTSYGQAITVVASGGGANNMQSFMTISRVS